LRTVASAKALFYGSENLDAWALKLESASRIELIKFVAGDCLIYFEQEHDHKKSDAHHETGDETGHHHHSSGVDPHFWTDPLTVKTMLATLSEQLCTIDPDGCEQFRKNADQFSQKLDSLHLKIKKKLAPIQGSKVMISHPFFQYFFKRYGIELVGIIETSPGREPTPKEIKKLIDKMKQKNARAIFDHIQLPDRAAKLIANSTDLKVYHLDPLGGVTGRRSYEQLLLYNAQIILEALQ